MRGQRAGHPVFVRLPPLPPGRHVLSVRAQRVGLLAGSQALRDLEGHVELKVRDPAPWKSGTTSHPGLAVSLDPPDPSLDAFWEGNVRLSVLGPEGRDVTCSVTLTGRNGVSVLSQEIGKFDLPITASNWTQRFKRFANDDSRAWKYLEASIGRFVIKGEELGEYALPLEREAKPVRWICRTAAHATEVQLADDTGQEQLAEAKFFALKHPAVPQALDSATAMAGMVAEEPGGLFFAGQGEHQDALVVSSSRGAVGFPRAWSSSPNLSGAPTDITALLALVELWHQARLAGPLAESRRELISRRLLDHLYVALCGSRWSNAEEAFFRNAQVQDFQQLERAIETRTGFAVVLRQQSCAKMEQGTAAGARWFGEIAGRYEVCHDPALCAFALRLASRPFALGAGSICPSSSYPAKRNPYARSKTRCAALHRRRPRPSRRVLAEVDMVVQQINEQEVISLSRRASALPGAGGIDDEAFLAALVRRAAGILCPCSERTIFRAVLESLDRLADDDAQIEIDVETAVEKAMIAGDLLEFGQATTGDPDAKGTWVFAAPPAFVVRSSGSVFLMGIAPDEPSPLPPSLNARIVYERHFRLIHRETSENLPQILRELGVLELSEAGWL